MNREIKFRAFDTLQGGKFEYWTLKENRFEGIFWHMIKDKSFKEVQQFTGLKDKTGKDIYEGDILASSYSRDTTGKDIVYTKQIVEYEIDHYTGVSKHELLFIEKAVIIGNIYQNPELIK